MNWNYIFTGLALVAIGLAVLLAPLPPSWWPSMSKGLIQATLVAGFAILLIGLGFTAVGITPALKDRSLWPQIGMVLFAVGFIACSVWYFFAPPSPDNAAISISGLCRQSVMPNTMPAEGEIHWFETRDFTAQHGGEGLGRMFGPPGSSPAGFPPGTWGVECRITNDSDAPIFNVAIAVGLTFLEARPVEGQPNSLKYGATISNKSWNVLIERLPGKGTSFAFYITNFSPFFVRVSLPTTVSLLQNHQNVTAQLIQPTTMFAELSPRHGDK